MKHKNPSQRQMHRLRAAALMLPCIAMAAPFAYVPNEKSGGVSVIDTATNRKELAVVTSGKRPWNMAVTPDGRKLYIANGRSNSVSVIDTATNAVSKEIPVGELPWGVVIQ